jgi:hypothetical protein
MANEPKMLFETTSSADVAIERYYLDDAQRQHILLGHRGLAPIISCIKDAVETPTSVYLSKSVTARMLFVSTNVTTGGGHPMKVIIEREGTEGKIITASFSGGKYGGQLIWDSSGTIYSNYDEKHDVLYISNGASSVEYAEEDEEFGEHLWLRHNEETEAHQGVTIFGLKALADASRDALVLRAADFLGVTADSLKLRLAPVLRTRATQ